jgi:hypothetical protein
MSWEHLHLLKGAPRDKWIEIHAGSYTGWVHFGKDGGGRTLATKPPGVEPHEFHIVTMPPGPYFSLRKEYAALVSGLPEGPTRSEYGKVIQRLDEMGNGVFETEMRKVFLEGCFADLKLRAMGARIHGGIQVEDAFIDALPAAHQSFACPGYAVGQLTALHHAWSAHRDEILKELETGKIPINTLEDVLRLAFLHIAKKAGPGPVAEAASWLHDRGQNSLELAKKEDDQERFYALLAEAGWQFYGAWVTYQYLAALGFLSEVDRAQFHNSYKASEEYHVVCLTSISTAYNNARSGFGPLAAHALRVGEVREKAGDAAAESRIDELIDHQHLYPHSWRDMIRQLSYGDVRFRGPFASLKRLFRGLTAVFRGTQ